MRRNLVVLIAAVIMAFLAGRLSGTELVRAEGRNDVHIYEAKSPKSGDTVGPVAGHVVGFTCSVNEETGLPDCWVLAQEQ